MNCQSVAQTQRDRINELAIAHLSETLIEVREELDAATAEISCLTESNRIKTDIATAAIHQLHGYHLRHLRQLETIRNLRALVRDDVDRVAA